MTGIPSTGHELRRCRVGRVAERTKATVLKTVDWFAAALTLSVEVVDGTDFDAVLPIAEQLLRTIRMPIVPA